MEHSTNAVWRMGVIRVLGSGGREMHSHDGANWEKAPEAVRPEGAPSHGPEGRGGPHRPSAYGSLEMGPESLRLA